MNFSAIQQGEDYKISFKLNIAGTSNTPSEVRACFYCNDIILCSLARLNENEEYEAVIPFFSKINISECYIAIEIILNGRLLVPYKEKVQIDKPQIEITKINTLPKSVENTPINIEKTEENYSINNELLKSIVKEQEKSPAIINEKVKDIFKTPIKKPKPKKELIQESVKSIFDIDESKFPKKEIVEEKTRVSDVRVSKIPFKLTKTKITEK